MNDDLSILCRSCGLCCDGSLFGRVPLEPDEVEPARRRGLRVVGNATKGFEQRCAALISRDDGCSCTIFADRPRACRRFTCRLYERHRVEGGPLAPRLLAVARVRELVAELDESGFTPADFDDEAAVLARGPAGVRALSSFTELMRRLEDDFARA